MNEFDPELIEAAGREREVRLTTWGRKTGNPETVTIWITTDGHRLFIRSGGGMSRDWPQNFLAHGRALLRVGEREVAIRPRQVTDPEEARSISDLVYEKYRVASIARSPVGQPLTPGEQATFELLPAAPSASA